MAKSLGVCCRDPMAFSPELDVRRAMATGKACLLGKMVKKHRSQGSYSCASNGRIGSDTYRKVPEIQVRRHSALGAAAFPPAIDAPTSVGPFKECSTSLFSKHLILYTMCESKIHDCNARRSHLNSTRSCKALGSQLPKHLLLLSRLISLP